MRSTSQEACAWTAAPQPRKTPLHCEGLACSTSLYPRVRSLAEGPHAERALAAVAFAESSFFPLPPDVLLAPMALANPKRAWRYALIATVASVLGGMLGYAIGALLYNTVGQWLINLYGYGAKVDALKQTYAQWGWLVILVKGVTPIPYKLVTITSGLLGYNFPLFVALSVCNAGRAVLSRRRRAALVRRTVAQGAGAQFRRSAGRIRRAGRRRLRDRDQGVLMTPAEIVLPPSQRQGRSGSPPRPSPSSRRSGSFRSFGYAPCELCLTQRYAFYAAIPLALLTALRRAAPRMAWRERASRFSLSCSPPTPCSPPTTSGSNTIGGQGPTACTGGGGSLDVNDLVKALDSVKVVRCDEVQLRIAGLSLAGWNVVASAVLAAYAALAARL